MRYTSFFSDGAVGMLICWHLNKWWIMGLKHVSRHWIITICNESRVEEATHPHVHSCTHANTPQLAQIHAQAKTHISCGVKYNLSSSLSTVDVHTSILSQQWFTFVCERVHLISSLFFAPLRHSFVRHSNAHSFARTLARTRSSTS